MDEDDDRQAERDELVEDALAAKLAMDRARRRFHDAAGVWRDRVHEVVTDRGTVRAGAAALGLSATGVHDLLVRRRAARRVR
jgi:hypothetical protein